MALQASRFDLQELYGQYFGKAYRFIPVPLLQGQESFAKGKGQLESGDEVFASLDGPSLGILEKPLRVYTATDGTTIFMPCTIDGIQLPNEPTIELRGSKSIVETEVAGRDGDVLENMGMKNWSITIRGIATSQTEGYPTATVKQLRDLNSKKQSLKIDNWLCNLFGIRQIAIVEFDLPDMQGHQAVQAYRFDCKSDRPITLNLRQIKRRS